METEVEGELLTPEELSKDSGWQTVAVRCSGAKSAPVERVGGISTGAKPNDNLSAKGRRDCGRAKVKINRGGRMPPLPKEDAKIIVRPMGGLNISKVGPIVVAEAIWNAVGIVPAKRDSDTMTRIFNKTSRSSVPPAERMRPATSGSSASSLADEEEVEPILGR
ncbi:hypothetical protein HPB49_022076 [Dermacentor silvarum]|uniref:Uncharacterized protein n=1 Tax=Dermacentor silvarum TaxID=543639 RepID=A0ACB8CBI9_DERSI|nr:hypothetical protein HPB49_022076 [Dermacentor silvarum]